MHRGRFQLGEHVPLAVLCRNSSGQPAAPDAAPQVDVYSDTTHPTTGKAIPAQDKSLVTGLFTYRLFLGSGFVVGRYTVTYHWVIGANHGMQVDDFEIVGGGHEDGEVISMYFYDRPHADFIVQQLSSGKVVRGRNPEVL